MPPCSPPSIKLYLIPRIPFTSHNTNPLNPFLLTIPNGQKINGPQSHNATCFSPSYMSNVRLPPRVILFLLLRFLVSPSSQRILSPPAPVCSLYTLDFPHIFSLSINCFNFLPVLSFIFFLLFRNWKFLYPLHSFPVDGISISYSVLLLSIIKINDTSLTPPFPPPFLQDNNNATPPPSHVPT